MLLYSIIPYHVTLDMLEVKYSSRVYIIIVIHVCDGDHFHGIFEFLGQLKAVNGLILTPLYLLIP